MPKNLRRDAYKYFLTNFMIFLSMAACGDASQTARDLRGDFDPTTLDALTQTGGSTTQVEESTSKQGAHAFEEGTQNIGMAGSYPRQAAEYVAEKGSQAKEFVQTMTETMVDTVKGVGHSASEAANSATQWADELEAPVLEQRERMCREEEGQWAEKVEVGACKDGRVDVTIDGAQTQQDCEGDGAGAIYSWQCVHHTGSSEGSYYFNDGPSVPHYLQRFGESVSDKTNFIRWNELFWNAAVNHDYCYHHGEATYGYSRQECDGQMLDDLLAICRSGRGEKHAWFDFDTCMTNAQGMFAAVRQFGDTSFNVMNNVVHYPAYVPQFDALDVEREEGDEQRRDRIESFTW